MIYVYTSIGRQTIIDASKGINPDEFEQCLLSLNLIHRNLT
ncbi:hypothetical protein [Domibacillus epiphyticus]|nr:hypothetical protein [Domibacillus epiphyticus]